MQKKEKENKWETEQGREEGGRRERNLNKIIKL